MVRARAVLIAATALAGACGRAPAEQTPPAASGTPVVTDPVQITEKWRAKHEADYRREWVTIAGLFPLKQGSNPAVSAASSAVVLPPSQPAAIGTFVLSGESVRFEPAAGAKVLLRDQPVTAPLVLKDDSGPNADELVSGDVRLVIPLTGTTRTVRVRDPNGPQAKSFKGFAWFPIDLQYRV